MTVGPNDTVEFKKAKEIQVGDQVWSATWDGLLDEFEIDPYTWSTDSINNIHLVKTEIRNVKPSIKDATMIINDDSSKRFSLEQTILAKKNDTYFFSTTGILEPGDSIFVKNNENIFEEVVVESTKIINEERTVYEFDASPNDILIAGDLVVHNRKAF
jgi:hypothetical protein